MFEYPVPARFLRTDPTIYLRAARTRMQRSSCLGCPVPRAGCNLHAHATFPFQPIIQPSSAVYWASRSTTRPGTAISRSNFGFNVLGRTIEAVTGIAVIVTHHPPMYYGHPRFDQPVSGLVETGSFPTVRTIPFRPLSPPGPDRHRREVYPLPTHTLAPSVSYLYLQPLVGHDCAVFHIPTSKLEHLVMQWVARW